ncbi:MAG: preprotein translocase subunit SecE [Solobacterium sp.]|jgi:preprotein translocase subunit SecE|nr:preprotein translocase subunit SecE [Solobacterium sp.]MCH4227454.1 preprotein translocase subunit SecE [Solobacterium sp.]MCH4282878.1 preprotein translocase subunit SecE [Solobacterium sp.]
MTETDKKADKLAAKETKKKEKAEAKKQRKSQAAKDRWFSISGINKEAKRVRWPHWKSEGTNNPGILQNSGEVILFTAFFAVFFVLCDLLVTWLLTFVA